MNGGQRFAFAHPTWLLEKIAQLEAENAELRRRLGMDSHNSDKPPSSDGYPKKTVKPGLPKDKKGAKGGQVGHQGNTLKRMETPDSVQIHIPEQCPCCQRRFSAEEAQIIHSRQLFDLPEPKEALNSEASVLKDFTGTAVHDCWLPYFKFSDARHVLCGAHVLRELAALEENGSLWAEQMREFLLD